MIREATYIDVNPGVPVGRYQPRPEVLDGSCSSHARDPRDWIPRMEVSPNRGPR